MAEKIPYYKRDDYEEQEKGKNFQFNTFMTYVRRLSILVHRINLPKCDVELLQRDIDELKFSAERLYADNNNPYLG